jgi:hypothetical protein
MVHVTNGTAVAFVTVDGSWTPADRTGAIGYGVRPRDDPASSSIRIPLKDGD